MCRLRNIALESVTDGQTDGRTDGRTDDGQSDPYVSLYFAGDTKMSLDLIFEIDMHNFVGIRSTVVEKMTLEVAIYSNFLHISETKFVTSALSYREPGLTLNGFTSYRFTVPVLFVNIQLEAKRSF